MLDTVLDTGDMAVRKKYSYRINVKVKEKGNK